jgi:hypothetical protein
VLLDGLVVERRGDRLGALAGDHPVIELRVLDVVDAFGTCRRHSQGGKCDDDRQGFHRESSKSHMTNQRTTLFLG